jgi:hypothetical protein
MIKVYDKYAKGVEYKDPQDKYTTNLKTTAYVDDINAHIIHNKNQTTQQIKQEIKRNRIIREKILYITGGKVSATKCTYYKNKWTFSTTSRPNHDSTKPDNITIQTQSEDIKITGISTDTYHKSLGYLQLIGKTKQKQVEAINKKMEDTLAEMREAKLSNNEFTIYYKTILTPKITYNLGLTSMSKTNSDTLTTKY